jgi:valyl-tRNA synthetase
VLDTWFSSWLWPFSTFGWPTDNGDLKFYYPTNDLVTASEIIFFWVARMIMAGLEFMDDIPFSKVYIHGTVRDDKGLKMSKSLGNSIDPLDIISEFSADALRFSLTMLTATGQDVYISSEKFEIGRNFGTKIWNAARFMQMHSEGLDIPSALESPVEDPALLYADDRYILASLSGAVEACNDNLGRYRFNDAAHVLYDFFWSKFCDWHVEYAKDTLRGEDADRKRQVLKIMHCVFANALKLLHPIMPFVTEELWHAMGYNSASEYIMLADWPAGFTSEQMKAWGITPAVVAYVDSRNELVRAGRALRADYNIAPRKKVDFVVKPSGDEAAAMLAGDTATMQNLLAAESVRLDSGYEPDKATPSMMTKLGTIYMPIKGLVDAAAEVEKLRAQLVEVEKNLGRVSAKLQNLDFVSKAPRNIVAQQEEKKSELIETKAKLERLIETLSNL